LYLWVTSVLIFDIIESSEQGVLLTPSCEVTSGWRVPVPLLCCSVSYALYTLVHILPKSKF